MAAPKICVWDAFGEYRCGVNGSPSGQLSIQGAQLTGVGDPGLLRESFTSTMPTALQQQMQEKKGVPPKTPYGPPGAAEGFCGCAATVQ
jgi:hypothetical protein